MTQFFLGKFWTFFVPLIAGANDVFAYFFGRAFGRTPLIKLSPNKTLEGFIGGAVGTTIWIYIFVRVLFQYETLTCISSRLDVLPFQPLECDTNNSELLYVETEQWWLPNSIKMSKALGTCFFYGFFTSFVTPFAGFFASGFKRAYNLKDFSNALPGHGGWLDRCDTSVFANTFMFGLLCHYLYKEYLAMNQI